MVVRDPTPSEVRAFGLCADLIRRTQIRIRRGAISEICIPSGILARSSSGKLLVYPALESLSTDDALDRERRRPRSPDATALADLRRITTVCERFAPQVRNGRLVEVTLRDGGVLRIAPSGELLAITTTDTPM